MTGAGFGGCTVNIVKDDAIHAFIEMLVKYMKKRLAIKQTSM